MANNKVDTCRWCNNWQRPNSMRKVGAKDICFDPIDAVKEEKESICEICFERHCTAKKIPYVSIVHERGLAP